MSQYDVLRHVLSDRVVAFHPELARALGGINEALFFQQLAYWSDKGADPEWIYKTQADITAETTLSRYQQEQARGKLRALGVIEEQKRGVPAKLYYRVVWPTLFRVLETRIQGREDPAPRMRETDTQGWESPAPQPATSPQPLTEMTQERTTERSFEKANGKIAIADRITIERFARDFAAELNDQAPLASTVGRLANLYVASGASLNTFLDAMQEARRRTQQHSGGIRQEKAGPRGQTKAKVPYWLATLEDIITRQASEYERV